jgi:NADPH2:quinone reductase
VTDRDGLLRRSNELFDWITGGDLKVSIQEVFPLAEAGSAQQLMGDGKTTGKLLLAIG